MENESLLIDAPFKLFTSTINDINYEDISSVVNWHNFGYQITDYLTIRNEIGTVSGVYATPSNWPNLTNQEKDIIIEYYLYNDYPTDKIVHLMTTRGMSQGDAIKYLQESFAKHHLKDISECKRRASHENVYVIIAKYLSLPEAAIFFSLVQNLFNSYTVQAIKGSQDGTVGLGLFDFIESTPGTIYENAGLSSQGFTMVNGDPDTTNLVNELMTWFRHGIKL